METSRGNFLAAEKYGLTNLDPQSLRNPERLGGDLGAQGSNEAANRPCTRGVLRLDTTLGAHQEWFAPLRLACQRPRHGAVDT